jgi:hypothetical protein
VGEAVQVAVGGMPGVRDGEADGVAAGSRDGAMISKISPMQ